MATHKSAIKAHKQSLKKGARNTAIKSRIKTFIKKVEEQITAKKAKDATEAMRAAESEIMRGVSKGVLKLNTAARTVSRLTKKVKALSPQKAA